MSVDQIISLITFTESSRKTFGMAWKIWWHCRVSLVDQNCWSIKYIEWCDFRYYMGLKPRILVADLDIIKQVLVKDISIFTNRPVIPLHISLYQTDGILILLNLGCTSWNTNTGVPERSTMEGNSPYFDSNIQFTQAERGKNKVCV